MDSRIGIIFYDSTENAPLPEVLVILQPGMAPEVVTDTGEWPDCSSWFKNNWPDRPVYTIIGSPARVGVATIIDEALALAKPRRDLVSELAG